MASLPFELKGKAVYVAGHRGMVGSALVRGLAAENVELLTVPRSEAELRDQAAVNAVVCRQPCRRCYFPSPDRNYCSWNSTRRRPSRDSYPAGTRNGASSTYHAQLDPGYLHSVISVRSFTSLSRWDRLSRVG